MKIGFLISVIGIFGSVREVIETANVFVDEGHEVFIFNPENKEITWIECKAKSMNEKNIPELDVLILTTEPTDYYLNLLKKAKAKVKIFCMMGFDQNKDFLTGYANLNYILDNYWVTADGEWQLDWFRTHTTSIRIMKNQLGGVNMEMFKPVKKKVNNVIGWSGDPRERKGGLVLKEFFDKHSIKTKTYWKKGLKQDELKNWFGQIDIFIDNHNRGGWCNPVAEAMACGVAVICSDAICNRSFAIDGKTCLKFPLNKMDKLKEQLDRLMRDQLLKNELKDNAYNWISQYNYNIISRKLLREIKEIHDRQQSK
jgi:glycosyltransferase involved in cell wall biosynthesis